MKSFTYERAASPAEAAAAAARTPGAKFIAGGTNLLDLMKLRDRDAGASDRRQRPRRSTRSRRRRRAACASARWCATPISPPMRACGATTACCRARCSPAPRASCATRRRPRATCCSARAAPISTTPTSPATSASPAAAARRSAASAASLRWSARATPASPPIRATWRWRCACSTRRSRRCSRDGATRTHPDRRLPPPARRHAAYRDGAGAGRADHGGDAAEAGRRHAHLPQGARPRVLCLRAGLGRRHRPAGRQRPRRAGRRRAQAVARRGGGGRAAARRQGGRRRSCSPAPSRPTRTRSSCRWSSARSPRCWPKRGAEP